MKFITSLRKNEQGFSIMELLLVVMIVGFIALVITNLPSSIKLVGQSKHESLAREIASQKMEDIRNQTYINLANTGSTPLPIDDLRMNRLPGGQGEILIEDCPVSICAAPEAIKKVIVKVSWKAEEGLKNIELVSLIASGGLQ